MARSVVTIDDLTNDDIEAVFLLADEFLSGKAAAEKPYRMRGRFPWAAESILATLFYEPSTRTRLSFESAMIRLGGHVISAPDGRSSSAAKGESIADTVRVVENYADLIVIRHPWAGAVRVAADYTDVPVINAGDGSHEHPTQTLCDLYTLRKGQQQKKTGSTRELLKDLTVVLAGDLRHGRTVHSLAYALARFGARIIPLPASPECDFPDEVRHRLARDHNCFPLSKKDLPQSFPADVLYVTPEAPHQLSLWESDALDISITLSKKEQRAIQGIKQVDAYYATRLQLERKDAKDQPRDYPVIDSQYLKKRPYRHSQVMHPLPRVDEVAYEIDEDTRSVYFEQAAYGVPVRMALIAGLLDLRPELLTQKAERHHVEYTRSDGISCCNKNCVTSQESEQRYLVPKFAIVDGPRLTLRCVYCDAEQHPQVVSRASTKKYRLGANDWRSIRSDDLVFFLDEEAARKADHQPRKTSHKSGGAVTESAANSP